MKYDFDTLSNRIDKEMQKDLASCHIGGAIVSVFQDGSIPFRKCYGKTNTDTGEDISENAVFRLASMTKPITAVAVLLQVQAGKINLDDPLSKYIPEFKERYIGKEENDKIVPDCLSPKEIKIYHLLTHTSGLLSGDDVGMKQIIPKSAMTRLERVVDYYAENALLSSIPGEKNLYSPVAAFDVAARLVEITSGKEYFEFLKESLFVPLEMTDTVFEPTNEQWQRMTAMHNKTENGNEIVQVGEFTFADYPVSYHCAGAGLVSTIEDYSHFAEMLLNDGDYKGKRIVDTDLIKLMRSPLLPETVKDVGKTETWGLGVRVIKEHPVLPKGAFGWSGAYGTHFWVDPENRLYAIYMKNSMFDGGAGANTSVRFEKCVADAIGG